VRNEFLPFARPSMTEEDVAAVSETLRSGWITTGPRCAAFEQAIADRLSAKSVIAVNSGTAAIHLILHALDLSPGDEVITPSMTWVSTVNTMVHMGLVPVFIDVDPDTLLISAASVEAAITDRTKVIVPVDFAGAAVDIAPIRSLADRHGIAIIEDAAHAIGTVRSGGEEVGSVGTAFFSLHPIKNITSGEGGIVVTDDTQLGDRIRQSRFHGLGIDAWERGQQGRAPTAEVLSPGFKYNMPDMNAALGLSQFARLDDIIDRRTELAMQYQQALAGIPGILPLDDGPATTRHARHIMTVRVDESAAGIDRAGFMAGLKERNIGTGIHFTASHLHRWYRDHTDAWRSGGDLSVTERNSERICSLPLFPDMTAQDMTDVITAIHAIVPAAEGVTT
jgi:UDP-4-amino-4-deoxy-L-arabinose-oxoglutarate aminotransferase